MPGEASKICQYPVNPSVDYLFLRGLLLPSVVFYLLRHCGFFDCFFEFFDIFMLNFDDVIMLYCLTKIEKFLVFPISYF